MGSNECVTAAQPVPDRPLRAETFSDLSTNLVFEWAFGVSHRASLARVPENCQNFEMRTSPFGSTWPVA